jgi:energy-converting hydrogenase Eha subunit C
MSVHICNDISDVSKIALLNTGMSVHICNDILDVSKIAVVLIQVCLYIYVMIFQMSVR